VLLPIGKLLHQNLNTTYTNFSEMLHDFRANRFSGYVRIGFWEYEGILIYDTGSIINAIEENKGSQVTGVEATHHILSRAKQKDGEISVHSLPSEVIIVLSSIVKSQIIKKDLGSEEITFDEILSDLKGKEITGSIEIKLNQGKGVGVVYVHEGVPVDSVLKSSTGNMVSGENVIPRIAEVISKIGATMNIHQGSPVESFEQSPEITAIIDFPELLGIVGELIHTVENTVDKEFGISSFENNFKRVCAEKSKQFTFLDPFAADFGYKNGIVSFSGGVKINDFLEGVNECLITTLSGFVSRKSKYDVKLETLASLKQLRHHSAEKIEKFGLDNYFATLW
jgi:hypothetical protein